MSGKRRMLGTTQFRTHLRYGWFLVREFRWALLVLSLLVLLGGLVLKTGFQEGRRLTYPEACFQALCLVFLEPNLDFPEHTWWLQPLYFLFPFIGLGALADSVVRLAYLIFAQKRRLPEWQRMVASLYRNHVVVVGMGKVGYRIALGLRDLHEEVVGIDSQAEFPLLEEVLDLNIPLIHGNGRQKKVLEQAGVGQAKAVIAATTDDLTNLDAAMTARDINPHCRIVLRLFDETLATKVAGAFSMPTISTAKVAAPAFIAAATGKKIYQELQLADRTVHLVDVKLNPSGGLVGRTVGEVQTERKANIVMLHGPAGVEVNPDHDLVLGPEQTILVIAPMDRLVELEGINNGKAAGNNKH